MLNIRAYHRENTVASERAALNRFSFDGGVTFLEPKDDQEFGDMIVNYYVDSSLRSTANF